MKKTTLFGLSVCAVFSLPTHTTNNQDLWGNPAELGWGVTLTHQADALFAALFIYDTANKPVWLLISNGAKTGEVDVGVGLFAQARS
jgi:hypothetical protein